LNPCFESSSGVSAAGFNIVRRAAKIFCDVSSKNLLISEAGMSLWRTADEHFSGPCLSSL
jgi:hypothetical protein